MNIDIIFQNIEFLIKMVLATSMGAIIGFERKSRNKEAGIRTHAIVCLASALMVIVSKYGFFDVGNYDAARVAAQVVSGIGFLGAGLYAVAIFGTLLIVIIQTLMHKDTFLNKDHLTITFEIELEDSFNSIREIRSCLERFKLEIQNVEIIKKNRFVIVKFYTVVPLDFEREHLEDLIFDDERVKKIEM